VACGADDIDAIGNMFDVLGSAPWCWGIHVRPLVVEGLETGWHRRARALRRFAPGGGKV
jgi:hypothetical protein